MVEREGLFAAENILFLARGSILVYNQMHSKVVAYRRHTKVQRHCDKFVKCIYIYRIIRCKLVISFYAPSGKYNTAQFFPIGSWIRCCGPSVCVLCIG